MRPPLLAVLALTAFGVANGAARAAVEPALARSRILRDPRTTALWAIPPLCAVVGCVSLAGADPARIGDLGLIHAIPLAVFASLVLLALGFAATLRERRLRAPLLAAYVVTLALLLPGAPALVEHEPRFATAWLHAGFADSIAQTGSTLPGLDARFNWPGFFAAAGLLLRGLGLDDPRPVLTWAPLAFDLFALVPVYAIAAITSDDARVPWLAAWLFVPANWIGQDYFAPQALGFALFLGFVVLLLRYFPLRRRDRRSLAKKAWRALRARHAGRLPPTGRGPLPAPPSSGLVALLLLTYGAIVWSHQLTPYFAIAGTTGLVLLGACRLRALPLLMAVIAIAFVSYLAVPYWAGHLGDIFGGVGQLGSTVSSNVGARTAASGPHAWVPHLRMGLTGIVWALALLGAALRWRQRRSNLALLVLFAAPYTVIALQSYGGEVLLRTYLFALPFAAALMGAALAHLARPQTSAAAAAAVPLATVGLVAAFYVARFGNEAFEMVRPREVAAVAHLYRVAPPHTTFVSLDGNVPWRYTQIAQHPIEAPLPIGHRSPTAYVGRVRAAIAGNPEGGYLLVTRAQLTSVQIVLGVPPGWAAALYRALARSRDVRLVYANRDARIYRFAVVGGGRA